MTPYTKLNLLDEVEDLAPKHGLSPDMEARFGREALGMEKSGLSYQRMAPNFRLPFAHTHSEQEETYVVLDGSGRVKVQDELVELRAWDAVRVGPGVVRGFEAGSQGMTFIAFGAPSTEPSDASMVHDFDWGD